MNTALGGFVEGRDLLAHFLDKPGAVLVDLVSADALEATEKQAAGAAAFEG